MKFLFSVIMVIVLYNNLFGQIGNLIWEDNFNNNTLDYSKWNYETGTGVNGDWGTGQLDRATARGENVSFENGVAGAEDGCLVITTRKEFYIDRSYTSGRINTAGKASWGPGHRIVARVYPKDVRYKGQGFAFWMMPDELPAGWNYLMWPQGGEVDIMEYVGSIPYHNLGGVHYAWFWENNQWQSWNHGHLAFYYNYQQQEVPNPSDPGMGGYPAASNDPYAGSTGFHTYGIDWYQNRMVFFIDEHVYHIHYFNDGGVFQQDGQDGKAVLTTNGKRVGMSEYSNHFNEWRPFEHKMYPILSAGVGGSQNTYGGAIVSEAIFPSSVYIDWVKVYALDTSASANDIKQPVSFKIFPNPTHKLLKIDIENPTHYKLKITDLTGKTMISTVLNNEAEIDISNLQKGFFLVWLYDGNLTLSKKLILD